MKVQPIFDVPITIGEYHHFVRKIVQLSEHPYGSYVCLLNVHMMIEAQRKVHFKNVLKEADLVTPDGKPITWALQILHNIKQDRVAGMDIFPDLLAEMEKNNIPAFFYGGTATMLEDARCYIKNKFPGLVIAGCIAPPFRQLSIAETEADVLEINRSNAKIIFIILGCPKQEIWMSIMREKINGVMIGIGGALPVLIGRQKRAPVWMQKNGLEWLFRLMQEPKRLFKRYTVTNAWFLVLLSKAYLKKLFTGSKSL